ncbi:papain fold toxin domain-containing protein [Nostoc sp. PA-18-2419]|uniref:papain fold toxin domain-containing protein n=1 Tax=Nostoc sp. PA-18-2419 TaxID=2575443 RepID=UPI001108F075
MGNIVIRFPILHCQECSSILKRWLKQSAYQENFGEFPPNTTNEDFTKSDRLEQQGCFESITENGLHVLKSMEKSLTTFQDKDFHQKIRLKILLIYASELKTEIIEKF